MASQPLLGADDRSHLIAQFGFVAAASALNDQLIAAQLCKSCVGISAQKDKE